jgi:hypothetical protein
VAYRRRPWPARSVRRARPELRERQPPRLDSRPPGARAGLAVRLQVATA